MSAAVTSIDATTGDILISWSSPASNGEIITAYKIEIFNEAQTTWSQDLTYCDGSQFSVLSSLYCLIPMSDLIASPFLLT
jgi:hypothetical protein